MYPRVAAGAKKLRGERGDQRFTIIIKRPVCYKKATEMLFAGLLDIGYTKPPPLTNAKALVTVDFFVNP